MVKKLKKSQAILLRANGISFYTTAGKIRVGVGATATFNDAAVLALDTLELVRHCVEIKPLGLCGNWEGIAIQIDLVD